MGNDPFKQNRETRDKIQEKVDYERQMEMAQSGDPDAILECFKTEFGDVVEDLDAFDEAVTYVDEKLYSGKYGGSGAWHIYEEAGQHARKAMNGGRGEHKRQ